MRTCAPSGIVRPVQLHVAGGASDEALRGRVPAGALLGQRGHERWVGLHGVEQPADLGQRVGDVGQQVVGALEAGGDERHRGDDDLLVAEPCALFLGRDHGAHQVVARLLGPEPGQVVERPAELGHRRHVGRLATVGAASRVKKSSNHGRIRSTSSSDNPNRAPSTLALSGAAMSWTYSKVPCSRAAGAPDCSRVRPDGRLQHGHGAGSERLVDQLAGLGVAGWVGGAEGLADALGHVVEQVAALLAGPGLPVTEGADAVGEAGDDPDVLRGGVVRRVLVAQLAVVGVRVIALGRREQVVVGHRASLRARWARTASAGRRRRRRWPPGHRSTGRCGAGLRRSAPR